MREAEDPDAGEACARCAAILTHGSSFCEECGTPVDPGRRASRAVSPEEQHVVARRIRNADACVRAARAFFIFFAVASLLPLMLNLFGGTTGADWVSAAVWTGIFAFLVTGAVLVRSQPFLWSILLASVMTLLGAASFLATSNPKYLLWPVILWIGVPAMAPVQRLLKEYPDLFVVRMYRGALAKGPHGRTVAALRERERESRRRALRKLALWGGGSLAVLVLGAVFVSAAGKPPAPLPLDPELAAFSSSWSRAAWPEVNARFPEDTRDRMARGLGRLLEARKWTSAPPRLGAPVIREKPGGRTSASFPVEGGEIVTEWSHRECGWFLTGIKFPDR